MDYFIILNICYNLNYKDRCLHKIIDNLKDSQHFKPNYISLGIDDDSSVCPFSPNLTCLVTSKMRGRGRGGGDGGGWRVQDRLPLARLGGLNLAETWWLEATEPSLYHHNLFSNFQFATRILVKANLHIWTYNYLEFCIATSDTFILPPKIQNNKFASLQPSACYKALNTKYRCPCSLLDVIFWKQW